MTSFGIGFFHESVSSGPLSIPWGPFPICSKIPEIFANKYLSPVSTTPAISCSLVSQISVILGVVDTCEQFSPGPLIRVCEMSMNAPILAVPNTTLAVGDIAVLVELILAASGASDQGVSMNAPFHGDSNYRCTDQGV